MGDKRNPKYNQSGCADPTAYEAISQVIKEEIELGKKVHKKMRQKNRKADRKYRRRFETIGVPFSFALREWRIWP